MIRYVLFVLGLLSILTNGRTEDEFCSSLDGNCDTGSVSSMNIRYVFYDVNPPEGFNLRRDVYMRMAVFAKNLKKHFNCYLVLPPWTNLYHWQSDDLPDQSRLPWSLFFDIKSLQTFAPVIEMSDFFHIRVGSIDQVYVLQHYQDMFTTGNFKDRMSVEPCEQEVRYKRFDDGYHGFFWGYSNMTAKKVDCLSFHGHASQLIDIIKDNKARTIMFDHAEVALHDRFGDKEYWDARKSMRFAGHLIDEARRYRVKHLNWTDTDDIPWPNPVRNAVGGKYLCVHMRRKDFLYGHGKHVPSIKGATNQINSKLDKLGLDTVFVATDARNDEKQELKSLLHERRVLYYKPTSKAKKEWKDGGVAIIEQIICSNAREFMGTYESTFSFRIQEEREIMGFDPGTTFQRLCGDNEKKCKGPSQWTIVN